MHSQCLIKLCRCRWMVVKFYQTLRVHRYYYTNVLGHLSSFFFLSRHFQIRQQIQGADQVSNAADQRGRCRSTLIKFYQMLKVCRGYYTNVLGHLSSFFSLSRHFQIRQQIQGADQVRNAADQGGQCQSTLVKFYWTLKVCRYYYRNVLGHLSSFFFLSRHFQIGNKYRVPIELGMLPIKGPMPIHTHKILSHIESV